MKPYDFKRGDRVQVTRFYLISRRPLNSGTHPKTEQSVGMFMGMVEHAAHHEGDKRYPPQAKVRWFLDQGFPPYVDQLINPMYIEPLGTPR